jgi:large subunit ribosomal protein L20
MVRVKTSVATRRRRKRILKKAKGFRGARSKLFKTAKETLIRAGVYSYRDRRVRRRDFRSLWITRIGAAAKLNGLSYSRFIDGLKKAGVALDRKALAEIAVRDEAGFAALVEQAKAASETT